MKLLITGAWKFSNNDIKFLKTLGFDCYFQKDETIPLQKEMFDVEGVICNSLFLYNDARCFKKLKFVQLTSAGLDRIPLDYFKSNNIKVFNAAGVYSIPIAEFVMSSVLDVYKKKFEIYEQQKKHEWKKQRDACELSNKVICIVGCGSIGKECAKRFKAFGCKVLGIDICSFSSDLFDKIFAISEIEKIISLADVIVATLPLTNETRGMFNFSFFKKMKKRSPIFVNVARGELVVTSDLIKALENKMIGTAILDVFDTEPLPFNSPLWEMKNVFVSPHNSYISDLNIKRLTTLILANLKSFLV